MELPEGGPDFNWSKFPSSKTGGKKKRREKKKKKKKGKGI